MILGMGVPELLVILGIALVIFGPKNLPKLGSALGKTVKNVREGMEDEDEPKQVESGEEPAEDVDVDDADADTLTATDAKFCTKCGAENAADAAFCKSCGAPLE
jgi:sec-independent protein translocase protein TatA